MKKNDYRKLMDLKNKKRFTKKRSILANVAVSGMLMTSVIAAPAVMLWTPSTAEAALVSAEIFSDITASNNSGTTSANPYQTPGTANPVNFTITGNNAVTLDVLNGDKVAVLGIPQGLTGLVQPAGNATVSTNVTLQLGDIAVLQTLIGTVTPAVDTLVSTLDALVNQNLADALEIPATIVGGLPNPIYAAASIVDLSQVVSVNLDEIYNQLDLLNQLGQFGQADFEVPAELTANERGIIANVEDGIFIVINQRVNQILDNLQAAQIQVSLLPGAADIPGISTLLDVANTLVQDTVNTAKGTLDLTVEGAQTVLNGATAFADQIAAATVLGQTTVTIPTSITTPTYQQLVDNGVANPTNPYEGRFGATMSQENLVTLDLFTEADGNTSVWFAAEAPLEQTTTPTITTPAAGDTTVGGTAEPGSTVTVTINGGTPITAVTDGDGNWTATVPEMSEGDTVSAVAATEGETPSEPATATVTGITVDAPTATIAGNSTDGYTVTGTATANSTVEIQDAAGTVVGTGTADGNGNYTIDIPAGTVDPEEILNATATVTAGGQEYTSTPTEVIVPADGQTTTPTVTTPVAGDTTVGGTAEPGSTVTVTINGGTPITTETDGNGNWTATVPELSEGDTVSVVAESPGETPSNPAQATVEGITVDAPTAVIEGSRADGYTVSGSAEANSTVEIQDATGTVVGTGTADGNGNYSIDIPAGTVDPEEILNVTATVTAGGQDYTSAPTEVAVPADGQTTAPVITAPVAGDTTVGGTAEPGSTVTVTVNNDEPVTAETDENGNWTVTVPELSEGDTITAVAESPGETPSEPVEATVEGITVDAPTAVIEGSRADGYTVSGSAAANSTVEIRDAAGTVVGTGTADGNGNYSIDIPAGTVDPEEILNVTATVTAGGQDYTSAATEVAVPADGQTTAPTVTTPEAGDTTVGGTAEPGSTVTVTVNDNEPVTAETDGNGNWTVTVPELSEGDTVTAVAESPGETPSEPVEVTVEGITVDAPTAVIEGNSTDGYTVTGSAAANSTVEIQDAAGTVVGTGTADGNGNYTIDIAAGTVDPEEVLNVTATVTAGGQDYTSSPTAVTVPTETEGQTTAPAITTPEAGDTTVGGTAEPGSTVTVTVNNDEPVTAETDENGNWTVTVPELSEGDTVTAVAESPGETPSNPVEVTVEGITVDAPTAAIEGDSTDGYTVSGSTEANSTVEIQDAAGTVVGTGTADANGNYTIDIPAGTVDPEEVLSVTATVRAGGQDYTSAATEVTVPADGQTTAPTVTTPEAGDTTVGGTAEPGSTVTVTVNDDEPVTTETDADGNWTVTVPELSEGDTVTVVAENDGKTASDPITVTVTGVTVATPTAVIEGNSTDGYTVTGETTPGAMVTIRDSAGAVVGTGQADVNGSYTIDIAAGTVDPNEMLTVTASITAGGQTYTSGAAEITVPADGVPNPVDPTNPGNNGGNGGNSNGNGNYGGGNYGNGGWGSDDNGNKYWGSGFLPKTGTIVSAFAPITGGILAALAGLGLWKAKKGKKNQKRG